jgi:hypothetical protein
MTRTGQSRQRAKNSTVRSFPMRVVTGFPYSSAAMVLHLGHQEALDHAGCLQAASGVRLGTGLSSLRHQIWQDLIEVISKQKMRQIAARIVLIANGDVSAGRH